MLDDNLKKHCKEMYRNTKLVKAQNVDVKFDSRRSSKKKVKEKMEKI